MAYPFDEEDLELDEAELEMKYGGHEGEHPHYRLAPWQIEVAAGDTRCGYWDWVFNQITDHLPDSSKTNPFLGGNA